LFKNLGIKYHLCDEPAGDRLKIHKKPTPLLGGLAMLVSLIGALALVKFFIKGLDLKLLTIVSGAAIICFFGFWDDMRWKHVKLVKLGPKVFVQLVLSGLVAFFFVNIGLKVNIFPSIFIASILTFFYIWGLINAVNLEDGMDGLAGGLVAISALGFTILSYWQANELGLILSLALLGTILGFLVYNFNPASIFMGDSGSNFLGLMLAVLVIIFTSKPYNIYWLIGPLLIAGFPIFDTGLAIIRRVIRGKSPFKGDRSHIYDKIHFKGLSTKKTVLLCWLIQAIFVIGGLLILK
jgi:UDP-GlcNAc:undecaprenyl-phosphate GlcNAc-1-phosphate transferase